MEVVAMLPDWAIDAEAVQSERVQWVGVENHAECTPACKASAIPCPYGRGRQATSVPCPYCHAQAGEACSRVVPGRGTVRVSWLHPSRLAAAQREAA